MPAGQTIDPDTIPLEQLLAEFGSAWCVRRDPDKMPVIVRTVDGGLRFAGGRMAAIREPYNDVANIVDDFDAAVGLCREMADSLLLERLEAVADRAAAISRHIAGRKTVGVIKDLLGSLAGRRVLQNRNAEIAELLAAMAAIEAERQALRTRPMPVEEPPVSVAHQGRLALNDDVWVLWDHDGPARIVPYRVAGESVVPGWTLGPDRPSVFSYLLNSQADPDLSPERLGVSCRDGRIVCDHRALPGLRIFPTPASALAACPQAVIAGRADAVRPDLGQPTMDDPALDDQAAAPSAP